MFFLYKKLEATTILTHREVGCTSFEINLRNMSLWFCLRLDPCESSLIKTMIDEMKMK